MASEREFKKRVLPQESKENPNKQTQPKQTTIKPINLNQKPNKKTSNKHTLKDMKIMYTNVDQFTSGKKHELENMVKQEKPHLIALCEVKLKKGEQKQVLQHCIKDFVVACHINISNEDGREIIILSHLSIIT